MNQNNNVLIRPNKRSIVWDAFFTEDNSKKPLVIFCHGYKGFKDWGAWELVAEAFANAGFFFVKFNFSHNGGTVEQPVDFPDLAAFAKNNYSKELEDLDDLLNYLLSDRNPILNEIDIDRTVLIGHSRGGGIVILKAAEDVRVKQLVTWAAVSDFATRMGNDAEIEQWKKDGVKYVMNGRTKQQMPHNYQFYEDFVDNESRLNIRAATEKIRISQLIVHAVEDTSVCFEEAKALHRYNVESKLVRIKDSDHVFGASHPWGGENLPEKLETVVDETIQFISAI